VIEVVNKHKCRDFGAKEGDVYIGRGSKWGNPFRIGPDGDRDEVCDKYEAYFVRMEGMGALDIRELLPAKRLGCFCKPQRCHGDYLVRRIEQIQNGA